jgi:DNA adenine methylase
MRPRPVLRYHGGKWLLAPWIISHFGPHRVYVEPFGGAASVLMRKKRSHVESYNDQWGTVVNVFRVLRDPIKSAALARMLHLTPFARDEFDGITGLEFGGLSDVERARCTVLRSLAGFGSASTNGAHVTGFRANSAASPITPAIDWSNYPAHIPHFVERLRGVVIENRDAFEVIRQHDSRTTLFYLDPPYAHATRNLRRGNAMYAFEMSDEDHIALASVIHEVQGMVIISGYECELYQKLFGTWTHYKKEHVIDGGRKRSESIWLNAAAVANLPAPKLPIVTAAH